jgi:hypothetical protein
MEELKDFIRQSFFEITEGVREANEEYKKARGGGDNAFILEPGTTRDENAGIRFDVAVTTKTEAGGGGQ